MKYFKVEKTGIGKYKLNPFSFVNGKEVVKTLLESRLKIIKGELAYNSRLGIPLTHNKNEMDLNISNIILETPGVSEITRFESSINNERKYIAYISIRTNENDTIIINI